ncbi:N-acetyltransferase eso1 [Saitoella coloradoensis]
MLRLSQPPHLPLAVQQWQGLIAINYPARAYGIQRHITVKEALEKCPELKLVHVQTWREGDTEPGDWDAPEVGTHKVSLDRYRRESAKILGVFRERCDRVEKASIDESYLDLSTVVYEALLEQYPQLRHPPQDLNTPLPPAPPTIFDEEKHGKIIDISAADDHSQVEEELPSDWSDLTLSLAALHITSIRNQIRTQLGYDTSAGIARNKMLAKLCSSAYKPNMQAVLRECVEGSFLAGFRFTKIKNLGGKLGAKLVETYKTEEVSELLKVPIDDLRVKLGLETGAWVWQIIRGIDNSEVNTRTDTKSMLSAKNFRPCVNTNESAHRWLRVLAEDLSSRLLEDPAHRRPKTLTLQHKSGGGVSKSKSMPVPKGGELTGEVIWGMAVGLLRVVEGEGRCFPCALLAVGLSGFEGREEGVQGIAGFLVKGQNHAPRTLVVQEREERGDEMRKAEEVQVEGRGLRGFFKRKSTADEEPAPVQDAAPTTDGPELEEFGEKCERCGQFSVDKQEHDDYHFAMDMVAEERQQAQAERTQQPGGAGKEPTRKKVKVEKGQTRLSFFK